MRKNFSTKAMIPEKPFGIFYFMDSDNGCAAVACTPYYYYYYKLIC